MPPFPTAKGVGFCCFVSRSYRGQGLQPAVPRCQPSSSHRLADGQRRTWQKVASGSSGQARGFGAIAAEPASPCVVVRQRLIMEIFLSGSGEHVCRRRNAASKWGVMKQLAGVHGQSEAVADEASWAKHHLPLPAVRKIKQIFVGTRCILVSVLSLW